MLISFFKDGTIEVDGKKLTGITDIISSQQINKFQVNDQKTQEQI